MFRDVGVDDNLEKGLNRLQKFIRIKPQLVYNFFANAGLLLFGQFTTIWRVDGHRFGHGLLGGVVILEYLLEQVEVLVKLSRVE